ncbi:MAG: DUF2721 domain-containing protein [Xanthobacteraceae bacterium]|nr:DUF2721 domain-containing protein [Xanthobacteraceae bacterium]
MDFTLSDVLRAIGPTASIIFAAWIFMGFLQQRYDSAVDRYRAMISNYRTDSLSSERRDNMRDQIMVYQRRCELMNYSCQCGLLSAILLLLTLIGAEADVVFPHFVLIKYLTAAAALAGFILVIVSAAFVLVESTITQRQLRDDALDVPDLAHALGEEPGSVKEPRPPTRAHHGDGHPEADRRLG